MYVANQVDSFESTEHTKEIDSLNLQWYSSPVLVQITKLSHRISAYNILWALRQNTSNVKSPCGNQNMSSYPILCIARAVGRFVSSSQCSSDLLQHDLPLVWGNSLLLYILLLSEHLQGHSKDHRCILQETLWVQADNVFIKRKEKSLNHSLIW